MNRRKTIGIITFQNANNYGAVYQAYALSKYLENLGYIVFIVNYQKDEKSLLNYLGNPVALVRKLIYRKVLSFTFFKKVVHSKKVVKLEQPLSAVFSEFRQKYLNVLREKLTYRQLVKNCPPADAYISGSDQIWSADFVFSSPAYLLGFVPDGIRKVAYAPSFGKLELEPHLEKTFRKHVKNFFAVSVREKSGLDILSNAGVENAVKVVDPTILLSDYSEIIDYSLVPSDAYIVVYRLDQEYDLAQWMSESISRIGNIANMQIITVNPNCQWSKNEDVVQPTPGQLLGLVDRSSLVLTNSFHGTVFAILLKTKFLTYARDTFEDKLNVRLTDLLSSLCLDYLYCGPYMQMEQIELNLQKEINYDVVHKELERYRGLSLNFLDKALA